MPVDQTLPPVDSGEPLTEFERLLLARSYKINPYLEIAGSYAPAREIVTTASTTPEGRQTVRAWMDRVGIRDWVIRTQKSEL